MALADLMELSLNSNTKKVGLSEERIKAQKELLRKYIAYWREYPDMFVVLILNHFYQYWY